MTRLVHITVIVLAVLMAGCRGQKERAYIKDAPRDEQMEITNSYTTVIQPGDLLYIYVYSQTPESAYAFNEETNKGTQDGQVRGCLVQSTGNLHFPILGEIEAAGKTLGELADALERRLKNESYVSDAIVTVTTLNYHVAVIGEVKHPRVLHSPNGRLTIFEALALAGDLGEFNSRKEIKLVREINGVTTIKTFDVRSEDIVNSEYYYIEPNDIIYIRHMPGYSFGINSAATAVGVTAATISFGVLVYSIVQTGINHVRKYKGEGGTK